MLKVLEGFKRRTRPEAFPSPRHFKPAVWVVLVLGEKIANINLEKTTSTSTFVLLVVSIVNNP